MLKKNLGHKKRLTHKAKVKMARRLMKPEERKHSIRIAVWRRNTKARYAAEQRKARRKRELQQMQTT